MSHAGNTWDGGGVTADWSDAGNWDPDGAPGYGTLTFAGSTQTTNTVDASVSQNILRWTGTSAWTLNNSGGAVVSLFDDGGAQAKIENLSTGLVTINAPINFAATAGTNRAEINAVNGDLTFGTGGTITVSGSAVNELHFYGSGRTVTINSVITAGARKIVIGPSVTDDNTIHLNAANSYSGNTEVNVGSVVLGNSTGLGTSAVFLGNGGATFANLNSSLLLSTSGLTVTNAITTNKADTGGGFGSGTRTIGGTFTSGTSTFSGILTLNGGAVLTAGNGGTVTYSGNIVNGTDTGNVSRNLTISGTGGTIVLSGTNSYTGTTTVSQGTLRLGSASALGTSSLVTVVSGATLDVAGRAAGRPVAISGTGVSGFALYNSSTTTGASVGSLRLNDNATVASAVPGANTGTLFGTGSLDLNGKTLTLSGGAFTAGIRDITSGNIMINSGATFYSQNGGTQTSVTGTITINSGGVMDTRDLDNTAMSSVHTIALNGGQLGRGQVAGNNGGGAGTILKNNITVDAVNGGSILNTSSGGFGINYRLAGSITGSGPLTLGGGVGVEFQGDTSGYTGTATGAGGTITFNPTIATQTFGGILAGSRPVVKNGVNTTIFAGANTYTGATTISAGTLVLAGANTGNSAFTVGSGATLKLDYATQDNGKLHDSSVLTLSGGTVDLSSATGSHTEAVASLTLTANTANSITRTGANTAVLALNTITRGANATLNFGAGGIATTDSLNSNGILGTWATIGGTDFAVNSTNGADGLITAPSYDLTSVALDTAASYTDRHMSVDSNQTLGGAITPFTLSYKSAGAHTLTLTGTNTIKAGGILISSEVGNNASSLVGGIVQTGTAGGDLRIVQNNTASTLTIGSVIQNNTSASTLTKSGAGTLILAGVNTYTGATNIAAGTLRFGNANAIATSGLVMTGGTADLAGFNANILGLRSDVASAGTITNSAAGTGTNTLSITGGWWGSYSGVIQNGATARTGLIVSGTNARFSLSGTNTFTGGLTINGAGNTDGADSGVILGIASDAALGATSNVLTLNNGGTLFNANSNTGGWSTGSSPTLAAGRSIVLGSGSGGVFRVWGATTFTVNSVISGSGSLAKTDGGILALGGTNTYTGVTTVSAGTIRMDNAQAFGNYISGRPVTQVVVASGGAVDLNARGSTYGYTIAGTGVGGTGALVNTGAAISNGSAQTSNLKLSANATIGGAGNWALLTNSFAATSLDLSGFTLTKAGANTIALVSTTTTAGAISVSSGTLAFGVSNGGSGVVGAASSLSLADTAGVSLSLARDSSIGSLAGGGVTGGGVALGSSTLTLGALNSNTSYAGVVSGTGAIVKTGTGTQTFSGANTYSGSTTVNGGTLALDYATQNNTKLSDTAALTFGAGSGTLSLAGGSHTEVVASTTLSAGALVNITRPSGTSVIQLGTLSVGANSTLNLSAGGIATTNNLNNANGILGSWATVGTDWAQSAASGTNIPITAYTGYANYSRLSSGTKVIANNAGDNARIQEGTGTAAGLTLAAATTNINTLNQSATGGATTVLLSGANNTLRLGTAGGILAGPGVSALTIGSAVNEGFLSAGGSTTATAGTLQITNNSSNTVTINSAVINNGSGAVTLVKSGSGLVTLAGNTGAPTAGARSSTRANSG